MRRAIVQAATAADAEQICRDENGWWPSAVREVDAGGEYILGNKVHSTAWMCFESVDDADMWDKQV